MLPHEVLKKQDNRSLHTVRPHSRLVEPTSRATGRSAAGLRAQAAQMRAKDDVGPFFSKAQVMQHALATEGSLPASAGAGRVSKAAYAAQGGSLYVSRTNTTTSPLRGRSPTRFNRTAPAHIGSGTPPRSSPQRSARAISPARHIGNAIVNPNIVLPAGVTSWWENADQQLTDEVVCPGLAHHRTSPDRSGYETPTRASRRGVGGMSLVPAPSTMLVSATRVTGGTTPLRGTVASLKRDLQSQLVAVGTVNGASAEVMAPLLESYGLTQDDILPEAALDYVSHINKGHNYDDAEGLSIRSLAPKHQIQVNYKSLALTEPIPGNTFRTLNPPEMKVNKSFFIETPPSPPIATKESGAGEVGAKLVIPQYHLLIDISGWSEVHRAPIIRLHDAFLYNISVSEHLMDRSLGYIMENNNPELFIAGTPKLLDGQPNSETRQIERVLLITPNPNICGTCLLKVRLVDNASVDPKTGAISSSQPVLIAIHILRNVSTNTAGLPPPQNATTPAAARLPPAFSSLSEEDKKKVIYCVDGDESITIDIADDSFKAKRLFNEKLYAPYVFPLPNLHRLREDAIMRNEIQILERFFEAGTGGANSATGEGAIITNEAQSLSSLPLPVVSALHPPFTSCLSAFELSLLPYTALQRVQLARANTMKKTEPQIQRAIEDAAKTSDDGSLSDDLCTPLIELANAFVQQGSRRQGDAIETFERVARIYASQLGFTTMADVGVKTPALAKVTGALHEEVLLLNEKIVQLITSLNTAAQYLKLLGRYEEASELLGTSHKAAEKYLGNDSVLLLATLCSMAELSGLRGDYNDAARRFDTAIGVAELLCGKDSDVLMRLISLLAVCYQHQGDLSNSIALHGRVLRHAQDSLTVHLSTNKDPNTTDLPFLIELNRLQLRVAVALSHSAYASAMGSDGHVPISGADVTREYIDDCEKLLEQYEQVRGRLGESGDAAGGELDQPTLAIATLVDDPLLNDTDMEIAGIYARLAQSYLLRGMPLCLDYVQTARSYAMRSQHAISAREVLDAGWYPNPERSLEAALFAVDVVAMRVYVNNMFNQSNIPELEDAQDIIYSVAGNRYPSYNRAMLLYAQLLRTTKPFVSAAIVERASGQLKEVLVPYTPDVAVANGFSALSHLLLSAREPIGPQRQALLLQSVWYANETIEMLQNIDTIYGASEAAGGGSAPTDYTLERIIQPILMTVFSAAEEKVPSSIIRRIEARIQRIRERYGDTSLRLVEPYQDLGQCHYLNKDYNNAHHYLSRALKVADTINFIFLLGHLFKPAVHLSHTDVQERNRVASDRLQPFQALQFASILYAIGGVYTAQDKADEAQSTYLQAQAALELGHVHLSMATSVVLASLAELLYKEGHYGDALAHIQKAITLVEDYHTTIGSNCPNVLSATSEEGTCLLTRLREIMTIVDARLNAKGYHLCRQSDGRHRFVVYM